MGGAKDEEAGHTRSGAGRWVLAAAMIVLATSPVAAFDAQVGWTPVQSVAGYRLYARPNGQPYSVGIDVGLLQPDTGGVVRYIDRGLPNGSITYLAVTAYDASGRESVFSNELSVLVAASPSATATATPPVAATPSRTATATAAATRTTTIGAAPTATTGGAGTQTPRPSSTAAPTVSRTASATPTRTTSASAGGTRIWGPTAAPANAAYPDGSAVELGLKFTSDVNGTISGIRFYKGATNTGTHTGTLWSSSGQRLATATFAGESAAGWQQVDFATPVAITANSLYVASYHTQVGHYAVDLNYFAGAGVDNPPLHALRNGVNGGNGVYVYGPSAFPSNTYQSNNYWVDVVFSPAQPVTPTTTKAPVVTATWTSTRTAAQTSTPTTFTPTPTATRAPSAGAATIWGPAAPATAADPDASAVELGLKFSSDVNGVIRGIRFYKSAQNTATHSATLWSSSGQRLATATFTGETASGWQQVTFAIPVAIIANTVYVASYHTAVGHYAGDLDYFAAAGVDSPPLHALRNGVSGGNGVYVYGPSAFPANTYQSSNYWVDVVFSATP